MPFEQAIKDAGLAKGDIDHVILVGGSTRMPAVAEMVNEFTGKEPNKSVNPDEVVAIGAAVQAGVLKGEVKDILLLDVTPLSLGIETKGGVMTRLIERNTTIPTRRTEVFTTADDHQPSVEIHVLQGEREMAQYNKTLGKFQLVDLPPAPRGVPQIEVTFDIDANGIVHVSAKDRATEKEQSMTITGQSSLDKDAINQMVKDAEAHAEDDRLRKEEAEVRNNADTLVYQTEKLLREQGDKISGDERKAVEDRLSDLKSAIAGSDIDAVRSNTELLMNASQEFTQKLYQQAAEADAAGGSAGATGGASSTAQRRRGRRRRDRRRETRPADHVRSHRPRRGGRPRRGVSRRRHRGVHRRRLRHRRGGQARRRARRRARRLVDGVTPPATAAELERDEYRDTLQRVKAEFDNYRKRTAKEAGETRERAAAALVVQLLPVLDACDAAVLHDATDVGPISKMLLETLAKEGLEPMIPEGQPFDPELHEAVLHEAGRRRRERRHREPPHGLPVEGPRAAAGHGEGPGLGSGTVALVAGERQSVGATARMVREGLLQAARGLRQGHGQGDHARLSQARPRAAPRRQPGQPGGRGEVQGGRGRVRRRR